MFGGVRRKIEPRLRRFGDCAVEPTLHAAGPDVVPAPPALRASRFVRMGGASVRTLFWTLIACGGISLVAYAETGFDLRGADGWSAGEDTERGEVDADVRLAAPPTLEDTEPQTTESEEDDAGPGFATSADEEPAEAAPAAELVDAPDEEQQDLRDFAVKPPAPYEFDGAEENVPFDAGTFEPIEDEPEMFSGPLRDPDDVAREEDPTQPWFFTDDPIFETESDAPSGFTGPSSIVPRESQESGHFVPKEDRWRLGLPFWDRYNKGHPIGEDYPYMEGTLFDPFNLNVLKGDYPIYGQHTFFNLTASLQSQIEPRSVPVATTPFESTVNPFQEEFFGNPNQFFTTNFFRLQFDLFHGNAAFKPVDWQIRIAPVFNVNYVKVQELGIVAPDVREGTERLRNQVALEEYWAEAKLADLSSNFDFVSARAGSQPFNSDFRGFIFSDTNRAVRLFGTRNSNRENFNLAWFDQREKDTFSQLNTMDSREQHVVIANYYYQDFLFPGYTAQTSFHWNHDNATMKFDRDNFLVRPDPVGVFQPHRLEAYYIGFAGDGHIGRLNVSHAYYYVTGQDTNNPLAGQGQNISAAMAAGEISYDQDWVRFRTSCFWASGDDNPQDGLAKGFDSIMDDPNFAGGQFSYWQRQQIPLFGVSLTNRKSLVADLRSSKFQGQSNFVNPGVLIVNGGIDFNVTQKLKFITNVNYLWFDKTAVLEQFVFANNIHREIGLDLNLGVEYRPLLNNNILIVGGLAGLIPGRGFRDLYDPLSGTVPVLYSNFLEVNLQY